MLSTSRWWARVLTDMDVCLYGLETGRAGVEEGRFPIEQSLRWRTSTQHPSLERAGEFAPAEEDPSRFPQRCEALTIFSKHKRHRKSHGRLRPTGYPSRALCHCVKHVVAAYVRLQKTWVGRMQSDINSFPTNVVSRLHPAHPSTWSTALQAWPSGASSGEDS